MTLARSILQGCSEQGGEHQRKLASYAGHSSLLSGSVSGGLGDLSGRAGGGLGPPKRAAASRASINLRHGSMVQRVK
jgi:hypothetical protein